MHSLILPDFYEFFVNARLICRKRNAIILLPSMETVMGGTAWKILEKLEK